MMLGSELTKMDINTNSELAQQGSSQLSCGGPRSPVTCFPRRVASDPFLNDPISPSGRPKIRHICNAGYVVLCDNYSQCSDDCPCGC